MNGAIHSVPLNRVRIDDGFWTPRQRLVAEVSVPYMERILRDEVPGAAKSHAIENFRIAAGDAEGAFYGMVFQDSDVAKWLEAAAYSLWVAPNPELAARMDAVIELVARAQGPDGYLNTYFTLEAPGHRWENLLKCHELYCAGHMIEAAVADFEVRGPGRLMEVARRLADCIVERFWEGEDIPGHQEIEIALLRLYRATGEARYRDMAVRFLDRRGVDPRYFEKQMARHPDFPYDTFAIDPADTDYNQSYAPVNAQRDARGHAVRMLYMLTAMADAADLCTDAARRAACERIWENITERRMYVTGGLGARAKGESFGGDYELPNDIAYNETCASVAMAFFMRNMLNLEPDGRYADVLELELYNGALAGMQLDGQRFFYVNPLQVTPGVSGVAPGHEEVLPVRPAWYACACCPPNLCRLIGSLGQYLWSEGEDAVYSHLFIGSTAETALASLRLEADYPWQGGARYTVRPRTDAPFALAIRVPGYVDRYTLTVNGEAVDAPVVKGYVHLRRRWTEGDTVELAFELAPRRVYAHPAVAADAGCVALARGPLVYCFEGVDNGRALQALRIAPGDAVAADAHDPALLAGVTPLTIHGHRVDARGTPRPATLTAIPYYAWGNRGENEMRVWLREE